MSSPASSIACLQAASASWTKRAVRWASRRSMWLAGSKSRTWQANLVVNCEVSNRSMTLAPLRPSINASQNSSTVFPIGLTVPIPVTTTLLPSLLIHGLPGTVAAAASPCQCLSNLTDQVDLDRLGGNPDSVLDGPCVRASMGHHHHPIDAQQRRATELSPVEPSPDSTHLGTNQKTTQLARYRARDLLTQDAEEQLRRGFGHLDGHVAEEPVRDHHIGCPRQHIFGLKVAHEVQPSPP